MFLREIGIDLGTANVLVYIKGKGIVLDEPAVVAVDAQSGQLLAVGQEAKDMVGRTPGSIRAIRPMKDGVIADFHYTQSMIKYVINKAERGGRRWFSRLRVVICVPSGVTAVEERAVREATIGAGAHEAYLVEEPMAAAIGAGLPVFEPFGSMVVDIGGGTTEVGIISLGGVVTVRSVRMAGDAMDNAIISHIRRCHNLVLGENSAEQLKMYLGVARLDDDFGNQAMEIRGRDSVSGLPRTVEITAEDIEQAIHEPVNAIVEAIVGCLEKAPPELSADLMSRGIVLSGGGSLLYGLPQLITEKTGLPAYLAEYPLDTVVLGTGRILDNFEAAKRMFLNRGGR